jgi:hypothetical protein
LQLPSVEKIAGSVEEYPQVVVKLTKDLANIMNSVENWEAGLESFVKVIAAMTKGVVRLPGHARVCS